jgi:hypothetical protein
MLWVKKTHLTTQTILRIPAIQVCYYAELLGEVLGKEFESDHTAQQFPALYVEIKPVASDKERHERNCKEEARGGLRVCEDLVVLSIMPLVEVLPTALEAALGLLVHVIQVLNLGINDVDSNARAI